DARLVLVLNRIVVFFLLAVRYLELLLDFVAEDHERYAQCLRDWPASFIGDGRTGGNAGARFLIGYRLAHDAKTNAAGEVNEVPRREMGGIDLAFQLLVLVSPLEFLRAICEEEEPCDAALLDFDQAVPGELNLMLPNP